MTSLLSALHRIEEWLLSLTILGLALIAFAQVLGRYLLSISFPWFEELGRYLGVFVTFLGAALGVRYGLHFSMDLAVAKLPPRPARAAAVLAHLVCVWFFVLVAYHSLGLTIRIMAYGTTTATMELPMWLFNLPIPFFSALMAWRYLARAAGEVRAWRAGPGRAA